MATRIKKQTVVNKEVTSLQTVSASSDVSTTTASGKSQSTSGISKRLSKKPPTKTVVKKTVQLKRGRKPKKTALKINPKNLARVLMENGKDLEAKKILLKNGVKAGLKRGRKTTKPVIPKIKEEPVEEPPPVLEPIFPQEENLEVRKTPKKRGRKSQIKIPELIDIKKIKSEVKTEPLDEVLGEPIDDLTESLCIEAPSPKRKPGRQKKLKADTSTIDEVMNDLSFLIENDHLRNEVTVPELESNKTETFKAKKLTKKQRLDLIKKDFIKKENIENTLTKLDPADKQIIDRLDLNVRKISTLTPSVKRRHSIEKFPTGSVDSNNDSFHQQLTLFNHMPRSISPRTSKRGIKFGGKRSSPYSTRSDSPARLLRNGKHRKLRDIALLEGLEDPKRRKRLHSDLSGSETASKLSGYDSDSSFSDLASLHGSEKDSDLSKPTKNSDNLMEESFNLGSKDYDTPDLLKETCSAELDKQLIDTNSNSVDINLNARNTQKSDEPENIPMEDSPSAKVPEKGLILDIMKQAFNDMKEKEDTIAPSICRAKFYGKEIIELKQNVEKKNETHNLIDTSKLKPVNSSQNNPKQKQHNPNLPGTVETASNTNIKSSAPLEDFPLEEEEAGEQASFENIVQGCIDSIGNISPDLPQLPPEAIVEALGDVAPVLEKQVNTSQEEEKDDSLPIIDNMSVAILETPNPDSFDNLEPPQLESSVPGPEIDPQSRSDDHRNIGISVTEKDNVVSFSIERFSDDTEEHDNSIEETIQSEEGNRSGNCEPELETDKPEEEMQQADEPNVESEQPIQVTSQEKIEVASEEPATNISSDEQNQEMEENVEQKTETDCDKSSEKKVENIVNNEALQNNEESEPINNTTATEEVSTARSQNVEESPEVLAQKESILNALGLQSLKAAEESKPPRKSKPSFSKGYNYTGTLKTVIKINKKKGKNSFKMSWQKNKNKAEVENSNAEEGTSTSWKQSKDSSDTAGAHRKSHYSNRSNMDGSSEHTSDGEQPGTSQEKNAPEKSLIVPEKASSFSIHPGRLCKDECSYCFGKFGLFDTPCHIAQMKSVERQNKILATEKHLTRDSCLCDACYRHVDRKSNSPSYINKSLKRNSLVAPGPRQNHCHVLGCNNMSSNILRRKWIIKMRKSICQVINIDLDNPGLHSIPICDEHFSALEHLMICAMCKRRLARNHIHYLGPEVLELNEALKDEGIAINLSDKPVVCKLCRCFASIILKDPEERAENSVNFFREYKKRLLHFNDIVPMDSAAAEEPIVVPGKHEKSEKTDKDSAKKKKRIRNSSDEASHSGKDSHEEKSEQNDGIDNRIPSGDTNNSHSANHSRSQSPDDGDEYAGVDYNTLIPAIAMDCPSDNESKKDCPKSMVGIQTKIPRLESVSNAVEISRTFKNKDERNRSNDLAAQKLVQNPSISLKPKFGAENESWEETHSTRIISNPSISVRQLFPDMTREELLIETVREYPFLYDVSHASYHDNRKKDNAWKEISEKFEEWTGEEELGLAGDIDFKNVLCRTPEGWEKSISTIQYDAETKMLWQELQKPYGSKSSFLRHLVLLEKYFRNGDLVLSPTASHHAINYRESVHNRLRAYDNIPSNAGSIQPISMIPFNKMNKSNSGIVTGLGQHGSNGVPPVTISQIGKDNEPSHSSKTPITLQQLSQPPLLRTSNIMHSLSLKQKSVAPPPGLVSIHSNTTLKTASTAIARPQMSSQKIKFPITKNWRPNLIPIDPSKKNEKKPGLVQVISGGKPYHITLEDYKKMCAIKRSFEAKQKKIQEQLMAKQQASQVQQSVLLSNNSVLKSVVPKKSLVISKTSGGTVTESKTVSLIPTSTISSTITSANSNLRESSESILEKLDKQVEMLGQGQSLPAITFDKNSSVQIIPRIPKSLTVIPQTVRKTGPPSPVLFITPKNANSNNKRDIGSQP